MSSLIDKYSGIIEQALVELTCNTQPRTEKLYEAMRYSLMAGGKRIRPVLTLEFCRMCGGDIQKALPLACAVEMIHTYSLIHDDLPCMDNDDFRRGKPACHKVFGEDIALIAGDALQALAFEIVANSKLPGEQIAAAVRSLSNLSGAAGMVGGQLIDITNEGKHDCDTLKLMYELKTAALIKTSCELGCIAAGRLDLMEHAGEYADNLGLAFQIRDDILDIVGTQQLLGKMVGSDEKNNKETFATLFGLERADELVVEYSNKAMEALDMFDDNTQLKELTNCLIYRNS